MTPFDTNWEKGSGATPSATQDLFFGDAISIPTWEVRLIPQLPLLDDYRQNQVDTCQSRSRRQVATTPPAGSGAARHLDDHIQGLRDICLDGPAMTSLGLQRRRAKSKWRRMRISVRRATRVRKQTGTEKEGRRKG